MSVGGFGGTAGSSSGGGGGGSGGGGGGNGGSSDGIDDGPHSCTINSDKTKQQKKVCFICGSYTTLTINIYEPRSGPNIVDVINQKFKVQPLNEDKFLCYSCNNWLINWHSLQSKNGSTAGGGSGSSSSGRSDKTKSKITQPIPEERNYNNDDDDNSMAVLYDPDCFDETCDQALVLREKLQKYLYYPKEKWPTDSFVSRKAPLKTKKKRRRYRKTFSTKCNLCGKPITRRTPRLPSATNTTTTTTASTTQSLFVNKKCLGFCQRCKRALQTYYYDEPIISLANRNKCEPIINEPSTSSSSHLKLVNPYVLSRLKKLGTTVVREGCATVHNDNDLPSGCAAVAADVAAAAISTSSPSLLSSSSMFSKRKNHFFIENPHEIQSRISRNMRNEKNEIVLAFDRTVKEVFPTMTKDERGCGGGGDESDRMMIVEHSAMVINDIYKRVPKSLSITLLA